MTPPRYSPPYLSERLDAPPMLTPSSESNYREFLRWFMDGYLPGLPVEILDTTDTEEWEFTTTFEAERIDITRDLDVTVSEVPAGEADAEAIAQLGLDPASEDVYYTAAVTAYFDVPEGASEAPEPASTLLYALTESQLGDAVQAWFEATAPDTVLAEVMGLEGWEATWLLSETEVYVAVADDERISVHDCEADAEDAARERKDAERSGCFPWVWNWCWLPASNIRTEDLEATGFSVVMFRDHRLCGINGAGYSFADAHMLPLAWRLAERWRLAVERDDGTVVRPVTTLDTEAS
jgi:hypothetical protein